MLSAGDLVRLSRDLDLSKSRKGKEKIYMVVKINYSRSIWRKSATIMSSNDSKLYFIRTNVYNLKGLDEKRRSSEA